MEEQVEEKRGHPVFAVVAQRDLGEALCLGMRIQRTTAQARTQRAHGASFRDHPADHRVGVLFDDLESYAKALQVGGQHAGVVAWLFLVQVHGDQFEFHRCLFLQLQQHVQQRVAVLATGQADHDLIAGLDHRVVGNGLTGQAAQIARVPVIASLGYADRVVQGHAG